MKKRDKKRNIGVLDIVIFIIGIFYIASYLYVALGRIFYPYELEWTEGGMFDISYRILTHLPIYTKPTPDYISLMYPPGFCLLSALSIKVFGESLFSLRIISFVASIISFILIFAIVKRMTKSLFSSFLSASIFFGAFKITGFWYDLARVDSLFIMLILLSLYLLIKSQNSLSIIASIIALSFAFFTKQSGAFFILSALVWLLLRDIKKCLLFLLIIPICLGITLLLDHTSDGWYLYWIYKLPKYQPLLKYKLLMFKSDLLANMPILCGYGIGWVFFFIASRKRDNIFNYELLFLLFFISSFIVSIFGRGIEGGVENAIIPLVAMLSILTGLAFLEFQKKENVIYGTIILQFIIFLYNPIFQIPSKMDRACGDRFLNTLKSIQGDVFLPYHGFYLTKAGKRSFCYVSGLFDVLKDKDNGRRFMDEWTALLKEKLEKKEYTAIITSNEGSESFEAFIRNYYKPAGALFNPNEEKAFFTIAGWKRRPSYVYLPK
ncbi:MAG: glycosyltransferase family 39 protein [bacterium]